MIMMTGRNTAGGWPGAEQLESQEQTRAQFQGSVYHNQKEHRLHKPRADQLENGDTFSPEFQFDCEKLKLHYPQRSYELLRDPIPLPLPFPMII